MAVRFTFKKAERLCGKKNIGFLFADGKAVNQYPFRLLWLPAVFKDDIPVKILISVPKRNIRKAVDRNTIKRRTREAYRLNKKFIYDYFSEINKQCFIALIYTGNKVMHYKETETKIILILQRFQKEFAEYIKTEKNNI